jgi:hypothetical protein
VNLGRRSSYPAIVAHRSLSDLGLAGACLRC